MQRYEQIRTIREKVDLTQREFGRRIGVSRDTIAAIETGRVERIQDVFFEHLCEVYHVNPRWLEDETEPILVDEEDELYKQALQVFNSLSPKYQRSALEQIKILLNLQGSVNQE